MRMNIKKCLKILFLRTCAYKKSGSNSIEPFFKLLLVAGVFTSFDNCGTIHGGVLQYYFAYAVGNYFARMRVFHRIDMTYNVGVNVRIFERAVALSHSAVNEF